MQKKKLDRKSNGSLCNIYGIVLSCKIALVEESTDKAKLQKYKFKYFVRKKFSAFKALAYTEGGLIVAATYLLKL